MPASRSSEATLDLLDSRLNEWSILNHPFYQAWQKGALTRQDVALYASDYYHHIAAFPGHICTLVDSAGDDVERDALRRNLHEEIDGDENHPELWLRFAEGAGAPRQEVADARAGAASAGLTAAFTAAVNSGCFAAGLAALYAYERQMPAVSATKIDGLLRFYGVTDERALQYFRVHRDLDVHHAAEVRALLQRRIETGDDAGKAGDAAESVAVALWDLLTAIGTRCGVEGCAA
ncbi:MAG: CADD family putative folate metabolism protein [Armatimonadetes bacterium]|nr:CADD family putative folate metabolism protein [Armatimonadota bacterium]MDE2205841.1 CADD family putative folate metabolism protein [Armatimonadota bacterium]